MAYSPIFGWNGTQVSNITGAAKDPVGSLSNARNEAYGMARTAANQPNAQDQAILAMLQERSGAQGGPFNDATKQALMTQAADSAGYAALQSKNRIQGSAGDPSVMAANNEADARRMAQIQQAQLGINTQANVANYDARGQALGQLGAYNQMAQNRQTDNQRYLMDMLRSEQRYTPTGGGGIPSFDQYRKPTTNAATELWNNRNNVQVQQPSTTYGGQQNRVVYGDPYAEAKAANAAANATKTVSPTTRLY